MLGPKVCALVVLSLVPDAAAITRWAWAKYRVAITTYSDARCEERVTGNDVDNEYGNRYILKSGKKCHTFPEPLRSYAYVWDPHTGIDRPDDKLCSIDVFEGEDCRDYAYSINATSWIGLCITSEGEPQVYQERSFRISCWGGNKELDWDGKGWPKEHDPKWELLIPDGH
ncbi:hypothetical protein LTR56_021999 [Elasticomyces elasticus]|nr:hypothetical protein LTR56_021999 [Elasticomyces elasticus]KAK3630212.1 hypothetical protein LTR22_021590 [Elasticomyces elasticus]KAK4920161.1 hypothetical protein LTR49_012260 [Elasticomyces elasticus]KAK5748943.1 hypothetical protein LTS12_020980 [Elasticomyces elasticus]